MEGLTTKKGLLEKFQAQTKVLDKVLHAVLLFCAHLMHGRQRSKTWPGRRLSSSELSLQVAGAGLGEAIRVGHTRLPPSDTSDALADDRIHRLAGEAAARHLN